MVEAPCATFISTAIGILVSMSHAVLVLDFRLFHKIVRAKMAEEKYDGR